MDGKIAVVTGANTGIGRVTARELARAGALVYLANRSVERSADAMREIASVGGRAEVLPLDLSSLKSVEKFARTLSGSVPRVDLLVANAGLAGVRELSADGYELTFAINHLGHFALTQHLLPKLAGGRVVVVASNAHYRAKGIDFDALSRPATWRGMFPAYSVSKLANVLFARELSRRYPDILACSLHPGVIKSDIWRRIPQPVRWLFTRAMISVEQGALTSLHCAGADDIEPGLYYDKSAVKAPSAAALDDALAKALWEKSEAWT
ncbi:MAG: SDR family NAD(P)-dependent oxidoreductase [Myxococcota bacterium]